MKTPLSPLFNPKIDKSPQREKYSFDAGIQALLMEYIASSRQEVQVLKDTRDKAHKSISDLLGKVMEHVRLYLDLVCWVDRIAEKTKEIALQSSLHSELLERHTSNFKSLEKK